MSSCTGIADQRQLEKFAVPRDPGSMSRDRAGSEDAFVTNYASPIVLEVSISCLDSKCHSLAFLSGFDGGKRE